MDASAIHEGTLEELQDQALARGPGDPISEPGLADIPGLLIVDDAGAFARHAQALLHLLEAATFGRMICVIVGPPASPPELDVPSALDFHRVPVLWVGDPRGVGWRIGHSKPNRLVVNPTDPDGAKTVADLLDALMHHEVYDRVSKALSALPFQFGVPALLPWVRWPAIAPVPGPVVSEPPAPEAIPQTPPDEGQAPEPPPAQDPPTRRRNPLIRFLLWLLALLGLRRHARPLPAGPLGTTIPPHSAQPDPVPPDGHKPRPALVNGEDLAHARWLMSAAADDGSFRQLCSARQAIMLGGNSELARVVRFGPAAARELIEPPARDGDFVAWTAGDIVGVIRLVPLKDGLLRFA